MLKPGLYEQVINKDLSADKIDMLVSFIKWSGLVLIIDELSEFTSRGGQLRIITTSYMGATDAKAVEELSKLPHTEIKVSYDTECTILHSVLCANLQIHQNPLTLPLRHSVYYRGSLKAVLF